jgi:hypothetical protein
VNALISLAAAFSYFFVLLFRIPAMRKWRRDLAPVRPIGPSHVGRKRCTGNLSRAPK